MRSPYIDECDSKNVIFTVYWCAGARAKLRQRCDLGFNKIEECDHFMARVASHLNATLNDSRGAGEAGT
eukprot:1952017-Karenia_brevis.AAC.1